MQAGAYGAAALVLLLSLNMGAPGIGAPPRSASICGAASGESMRIRMIRVDGFDRDFLLYLPPKAARVRLPIVFAFHGRGETPELFERYAELSRLAAIVVYPRGLPGRGGKPSWSGTPTAAPGINDVNFARAIFARLRSAECVDATRVYVTGKSDGGGLAAQLACSAADIVSAAAPVAGAYYPVAGGCKPARPVAIAEFHGTADRVVPYGGSARRGLPGILSWETAWAMRNGCSRTGAPRSVASGVRLRRWTGCRGRSVVEGYEISGGGHTWPGSYKGSGPGATSQAIDATALIAAFFEVSVRSSRSGEH